MRLLLAIVTVLGWLAKLWAICAWLTLIEQLLEPPLLSRPVRIGQRESDQIVQYLQILTRTEALPGRKS